MRRVSSIAACTLLLTVGLAGCFGDDEPGQPGPPDDPDLSEADPFTIFMCTTGLRTNLTGALDVCNHRVTKPLEDAARFDWMDQHGPGNEVSIAVNPTNPLEVAGGAKDYTVSYISDHAGCGEYTVWMGTFWSTDGGLTWGNDLMRGFPGDERDSPLSGNQCNTDPVLVYDDDGTLWYSGLNYRGAREDQPTVPNPLGEHDALTGSQLYFARSTDGGATYPFMRFASAGDNDVVFNDKQWFALEPGGDHMIATWSQFWTASPPLDAGVAAGDDVIAYVESLDGGQTWGAEKLFRPGGDTSGPALPASGQFSMAQYLPDSQTADLGVIWWDGDRVLYAEGVVTPAGAEFGPVQSTFPVDSLESGPGRDGTGPTTFRLSTYPVLGVDASGGDCDGSRYVVWPDQPGGLDTDVQVLLRHSDDGVSWSEPVTVNDVEAGDQLMPWIDIDPEGGVHVAWYDRRNDPDNRLMDVYYSYSDDCGETFHPNVRVTETNFDGDLGHHQNGDTFIGDYIGVDTTDVSVHIIWSDTRHSCDLDTPVEACPAPMRIGSDVYAATLIRDANATAAFAS